MTGGRTRDRAVVLGAIVVVLAASGVPSPLYDLYEQRWATGATTTATVFAAYSVGVVTLLALGPAVVRVVGLRVTLLLALVAVVLSSAVFVAADLVEVLRTPLVLGIGRVGQGLGVGLVNAAGGAALAEVSRREGRPGAAAAAVGAAVPSGVALGAALAGVLAQFAPLALTTPYLVIAVLALGVGVGTTSLGGLGRSGDAVPSTARTPDTTDSRVPVAAALTILSWGVGGIHLALSGSLLGALLPVTTPVLSGAVVLLVQGAGGLMQILVRRAPLRATALLAAPLLVAGTAVAFAGAASGSTTVFVAAALVTGVGFGLGFSGSIRIAGRSATSRSLSRYFLLAYTSMSLAAVLTGALLDALGPARALAWCTAGTAALALLSTATVRLLRSGHG